MRKKFVHSLRPVVTGLLLVLAGPRAFGAAAGAGDAARLPVLTAQPDGSYQVEAPGYRAAVGADGNLHSFRIGETELLDDHIAFSRGAFLYAGGPVDLQPPVQLSPTILEARSERCTIQYRFARREIRVVLRNPGSEPLTYYVVLSPDIVVAANSSTGEAAAAPATESWPDVRLLTRTGVYAEVAGGSRIWGPWLGRQVWEISKIPPGEHRELRLGGGVGEPPEPTLEQLVGIRAEVAAPEALIEAGDLMEVRAQVENRSELELSGLVSMELTGCRSDLLRTATSPVKLAPRHTTETAFRAALSAPDFYTARLVLAVGGTAVGKAEAAAGYRVSEIRPAVEKPDGFQQFWQRLVEEAGETPPACEVSPDAGRSRENVIVAVVEYEGLAGTKIRGWYLRPPDAARHAALLYLSGYGARPITPPMALAEQGYVVLAIDVRGNQVNVPRPRAFEDYCTEGLESPETYVYREIVGHCLRALRLLGAQEEVDPERMGVVGTSEGGGLALILAALSPEVKAVAADAPLLCDFSLSVAAGGWPYTEIARYLEEHPAQDAQVKQTLSYFDLANFAADVKCPVLLTVGFRDRVSLPAAAYGVFNLLGGPKEVKPLPEAGHEGGGEGLWALKLDWLGRALSPSQ